MEEVRASIQLEKIKGYEKGFFATFLINMGSKLRIFDALQESRHGITAKNLAVKLGLHEQYAKTWCQTAYHFEILDCDEDGKFYFAPFMDEILWDKSNIKNYLWTNALEVDVVGINFPNFVECYKTGKCFEESYSPEVSRIVSGVTQNLYLAFVYMIIPQNERLQIMLEQGINFLDVGCGSGILVTKLAQIYESCNFMGIDPDTYAIEEAKNKVTAMGLRDRVTFKNMRGEDLEYDNEFDLVSMVSTLHEIRPAVREKVVDKVHAALRKGGQFLVLDLPFPSKIEDFRNPDYDFAIHDQFFEICMGILHISTEERDKMFRKAGFSNLQRMNIGKGMFEFIIMQKM
jgi:ubiquinone/menaquinone biosynthesis C-methylase UbiE